MAMRPDDYADLVAFLAGLHDLGKFTRNFQGKEPALWPEQLGVWPGALPLGPPHWRATALLLQLDPLGVELASLFPSLGGANPLIAAIAGHHGRPPPNEDTLAEARNALRRGQWLDAVCLGEAQFAFDAVRRATGARPAPSLSANEAPLFSWRLAGLVTLADWVGSDASHFGPAPFDTPLDEYWRKACSTAERALRAKGLLPLQGAAAPRLADLSPRAAASPRPMQRLAETLLLGAGPQLIVIEDATGSGKTEAALLLAARMMTAGLGEGVYFALPTMATANAIHKRLREIAPRLFAATSEAARPSVILSHGKSAVAAALAQLEAKPTGDGEETTAASCNAWIADDRRRAFFADVGAGTIDQAFLAILPKKHLTLRQYALAGRILIVDEAHCFDKYMQVELGALLRSHAMNGGSAVVLSATLAGRIRREIARGFYAGLGISRKQAERAAASCASTAYPLLTHLTRDDVGEHAPGLDAGLARSVAIERLENRTDALRVVGDAADADAAVLVICNAVDEAIAFHAALSAERTAGEVHLFHARFVQGDRIDIEDAVLARFGRDAPSSERAGHVLVATQVVEQSLDLDFDLIVSDLAPIDLLIQRAGRLWRHMDKRPAEARPIPGPKMCIVSPDPATVAAEDWLEPSLSRAAFVYQHAGVMWRTARTIFERGALEIPDDLRPMIEAVYGEAAEPVPEALRAAELRGEGQAGKAKALGGFNVVDLARGYGALPPDLRADEEIGTRLGEETVTVRLARREAGALVPWFRAGRDAQLDWALSELSVRRKFWGRASMPDEDKPLHDAARKDWTEWEDGVVLAEVEADGQLRLGGTSFEYSAFSGLAAANRPI